MRHFWVPRRDVDTVVTRSAEALQEVRVLVDILNDAMDDVQHHLDKSGGKTPDE